MIYMLDTDIMIYLINRKPGYENIARKMSGHSPGELRLSVITLAELEYGIENSQYKSKNQAALEDLLIFFEIEDFPRAATKDYAQIKYALKKKGKPIGPYDLLIAAHARYLNATIVTHNLSEFSAVPGLSTKDWSRS